MLLDKLALTGGEAAICLLLCFLLMYVYALKVNYKSKKLMNDFKDLKLYHEYLDEMHTELLRKYSETSSKYECLKEENRLLKSKGHSPDDGTRR